MDIQHQHSITSIITNIHSLSQSSYKIILDNCRIHRYVRNQLIATEGKTNLNEYFLLEGVMHRFSTTDEGENITTDFYLPASVVTPHFARTIRAKITFSLQALTVVVVAEISAKNLDDLRNQHKDIRTFGQKVVEAELTRSLHNGIAFRSTSAKERLLSLRKTYPNLENTIPHIVIASFLGITPVSFSRLRNELTKSK